MHGGNSVRAALRPGADTLQPPLRCGFRCVVPDHMGMGKSGVPAAPYPYQLRHHVANVETLLPALDLQHLTLIVHDWGGRWA
jgi:cis-3-alkyl-4-acyloxetan-2-one decarboxylase